MSDFWAGVLLGFVFNIVASKFWEVLTRSRSHRFAKKLAGEWIAYNVQGRIVEPTPMPGALLTVISAKPWWASWTADSHILDIRGEDILPNGNKRVHDGYLAIDPTCPCRATRTVRYLDSDEILEQRIEISRDGNTLFVFPVDTVATLGAAYNKHALRRKT